MGFKGIHRSDLILGAVSAMLAGWMFREGGRQPWLIAGVLRTKDAVRPMSHAAMLTSTVLITTLFVALAVVNIVLVTHRLAPLAAADEIVVLDQGRVVQRGPHDALVSRAGPYRDLWAAERLQAGSVPVTQQA